MIDPLTPLDEQVLQALIFEADAARCFYKDTGAEIGNNPEKLAQFIGPCVRQVANRLQWDGKEGYDSVRRQLKKLTSNNKAVVYRTPRGDQSWWPTSFTITK